MGVNEKKPCHCGACGGDFDINDMIPDQDICIDCHTRWRLAQAEGREDPREDR